MEKITFWLNHQKFEYTRMPFGLKNAPIYFQKIMDAEIDRHNCRQFTRCFIDDLIVFSTTAEEHLQHLRTVMNMLAACQLRFHPSKSVFMTDSIEYLGHYVSPYGLSPAAAKVKAIHDMAAPKSVEDVRATMGFFQYYAKYVPNFSAIARAITDLTKKSSVFHWGPPQEHAFQRLKAELTAPGRALRRPDFNRPFVLHTDFSNLGIAAVLGQVDEDNQEYMVAAVSRSLTEHERVYSPYQGELLAAVWGVKTFHLFLHGARFTLVTDHQPLQWLFSRKDLQGQSARWVLLLQEFDFEVQHRPGHTNGNADTLSRFPLPASEQAPMYPPLAALTTPDPPLAHTLLQKAFNKICLPLLPRHSIPAHLQSPAKAHPADFHVQAKVKGIIIVELCAGIATGLDVALRLGYTVQAYAYSDNDAIAQAAAACRVHKLHQRYPHQFSADAADRFLSLLPQDVRDIRPAHLAALATLCPNTPILVVAGWPCQDLSAAGTQLVLDGP